MQQFVDIENFLMSTPSDDFISMLLKNDDSLSLQMEDSRFFPSIDLENIEKKDKINNNVIDLCTSSSMNENNISITMDDQKNNTNQQESFKNEFLVSKNNRPDVKNQPPRKKRKVSPVSIEKLIQPLSKEQLEKVILKVVEHVPSIEDSIRINLPLFDVTSNIQELQKLKQKVFQSFPHTRYGSSYDHYSFTRVKSSQSAFITAARKPISILSTAKQWKVLLEYLLAIIEEASELPDWDVEEDRKQKQKLFKSFATNLLKVLKQLDESELTLHLEHVTNLCKIHNTNAHGIPFNDCLSFLDFK